MSRSLAVLFEIENLEEVTLILPIIDGEGEELWPN